MLEIDKRSGDADSDQEELEAGVDLGDGGGLDGGRGQGRVEVLLEREGRDYAHVADVEAGVDEEQVPRHDQSGERGGDQVGVGQRHEHAPYHVQLMKVT